MENIILNTIVSIIENNKQLLRIPIRQKAKFEGWLKFELASELLKYGYDNVKVENSVGNARSDITFTSGDLTYDIELKTSNTNWKIPGVFKGGIPITNNIDSIIRDAIKLNSMHGIIAFILFPIPTNNKAWETYIQRIALTTGAALNKDTNCKLVEVEIDDSAKCEMLVCTFISNSPKYEKLKKEIVK